MNSCNMVILNGIDTLSKYTCINGYRGASVIDYIIVQDKLLQTTNIVKYVRESFKVWEEDMANISDHRLITCNIEISSDNHQQNSQQSSVPEAEEGEELEKESIGWR